MANKYISVGEKYNIDIIIIKKITYGEIKFSVLYKKNLPNFLTTFSNLEKVYISTKTKNIIC